MAWVAVETFDTYSDGDLNGNNGGSGWAAGWSGDADYDVQGTITYNGSAKAVSTTGANGTIARTLTSASSSGVVYVAIRYAVATDDFQVDFITSGVNKMCRYGFRNTNDLVVLHSGGVTVLDTAASTTTWYLAEITYNGTTFDIRYHNGTAWSTPVTGLGYEGGAGDLTIVSLNGGLTQTCYVDYISPTNPIVDSNIKSLDTNVRANIKSYNTNVLANIKSINTNP